MTFPSIVTSTSALNTGNDENLKNSVFPNSLGNKLNNTSLSQVTLAMNPQEIAEECAGLYAQISAMNNELNQLDELWIKAGTTAIKSIKQAIDKVKKELEALANKVSELGCSPIPENSDSNYINNQLSTVKASIIQLQTDYKPFIMKSITPEPIPASVLDSTNSPNPSIRFIETPSGNSSILRMGNPDSLRYSMPPPVDNPNFLDSAGKTLQGAAAGVGRAAIQTFDYVWPLMIRGVQTIDTIRKWGSN